jgi:hypothetical protein
VPIGDVKKAPSMCIDLWFDMGACAREGSTVEAYAAVLLHTLAPQLT